MRAWNFTWSDLEKVENWANITFHTKMFLVLVIAKYYSNQSYPKAICDQIHHQAKLETRCDSVQVCCQC